MSSAGSIQNGSFAYKEYDFEVTIRFGNASQSSQDEVFVNQTNPSLSYIIENGARTATNASASTTDNNAIGSSPLIIFDSDVVAYGYPGLWLAGLPSPQFLNHTTATIGNSQVILKAYSVSYSSLQTDPITNQQVNATTTFTARFATFQGTNVTFCYSWNATIAADDGSFTQVYTFEVTALQRT